MYQTERTRLIRLLRIASQLNSNKRKKREKRPLTVLQHIFRYYVVYFQLVPFVISMIALACRKFLNADEASVIIGLVSLLFFYLATLLSYFIDIFINRHILCALLKDPVGSFLESVDIAATVDERILSYLMKISTDSLELFLLEIKAKKEEREKRILLLVGSIDKIGILPGLLAVLWSFQSKKIEQPDWLSAFTHAIPIFYFIAFVGHLFLMPLDKSIKLLELALTKKKNAEKA